MQKSDTPKRRNATKTRASILAAAFESFSTQGYAKTGTREIASKVGVSSSLIGRYFGTKSKLFEEALIYGIYHNSLFIEEKADFGARMAQLIANESNPYLTAMVVLAIADPESKQVAQKVTHRHVVTPLAEWLGPPNANARALSMLSLMHGFTIQTLHLSNQKVPKASIDWLAQALQQIVDQS